MADRNQCPAYATVFAYWIPWLKNAANKLGYALAVHGSMATDLDLIACPWTDDAVPAAELAEAIREAVGGHRRMAEGRLLPESKPTVKPQGRLAWTFYLNQTEDGTSFGPYIDLSVMPRLVNNDICPRD